MKKVLFLGNLHSGGAEHQMVVIASLFKREGYDVTYLTSDQSNFYAKELQKVGIPIIRIQESKLAGFFKLNIPRNFIKLRSYLKKNRFDTVVSFLVEWNFYNCLLANKRSTYHKAITGIRNNRDEVFLRPREKFYSRFERYAFCKVSNSEAARVKYAEYFPKVADKLMTIYNIVDLPQITSSYSCRKNGRVNIIIPASYRKVKNPMGMLHAVASLKNEDLLRLHIDWYGNIKDGKACYEEMKVFITEHGLEKEVTLHDATNDIANRTSEADVVGLFSTSEGLPNAVCEGMMLGKPIIMTRVSDYDVLVGEENGFLCDAENIQTIADALCSVAKLTDDEIMKMGSKSKEKALRLFSAQVVLDQWKRII